MGLCRIFLLVSVLVVFSAGLLMVFSASSAEVLDDFAYSQKSTHHALIKQIVYAGVGCTVALVVWQLGYHHFLRLSFPMLLLCSLLLLLVFVPGIGQMRNGAYRWLGIGGYTIQPSEFVKLVIPAYFINFLRERKWQISQFRTFCFACLMIAVPVLLIMIEPDNGTMAIIVVTMTTLIFVSGIRARFWVLPMATLFLCTTVVALNMPYVAERIKVYCNPELDVRGWGHQPYQAKIATGSGGLLGRGPGNSLQKMNYLPEAQNDYIAAIFAEECGFVGVVLLLLCYMSMTFCGFSFAFHAQDKEGCYLAVALTFLVAIQAFLNLAVVSGTVPSTGLNLPLFSQGGTSLMVNIIAVTLLLNISWKSEQQKGAKNAP